MKSRSLIIQGQKWRVVVTKRHKMLMDARTNKLNMGTTAFSQNTIYILKTLPEQSQKSTLLHEILHVLENNLDLKLPEGTIMRLEAGLYAVLHDNKLKF